MSVQQYVTVTQSGTTYGPGVYIVTATGITLTLEAWIQWADKSATIYVKDQTGSSSPNITILPPTGGTIDGASSLVMTNKNEALRFLPSKGGYSYVVI